VACLLEHADPLPAVRDLADAASSAPAGPASVHPEQESRR